MVAQSKLLLSQMHNSNPFPGDSWWVSSFGRRFLAGGGLGRETIDNELNCGSITWGNGEGE